MSQHDSRGQHSSDDDRFGSVSYGQGPHGSSPYGSPYEGSAYDLPPLDSFGGQSYGSYGSQPGSTESYGADQYESYGSQGYESYGMDATGLDPSGQEPNGYLGQGSWSESGAYGNALEPYDGFPQYPGAMEPYGSTDPYAGPGGHAGSHPAAGPGWYGDPGAPGDPYGQPNLGAPGLASPYPAMMPPARPSVGFGQAIKNFFANYATFSGRASLSEYWWVVLFQLLVGVVLSLLGGVPGVLWGLATIIPGLSVSVRRLHDTGRSGASLLFALIPFIGWIFVLAMLLGAPNPQGARFDNPDGSQPKNG